jgi:hypothetical protein
VWIHKAKEIATADWEKVEARATDKDKFMCFDAFHALMFEVYSEMLRVGVTMWCRQW